ncbi:hypothetical protein [Thermococcus alcaliphilus]|uniref:hypothetical protein n=1 Tax=Thermococcus alcaliphilus TaxID=139207 RepID=UPI0020911BB5|nr:hypothetical protein [Thermococcus alcaliphilus]MCO6041999.1 hypothetical protein [Thermococcus alcaliphilus]
MEDKRKLFLPNPQLVWELKNNKAIIYMPDKELGLDKEGTEMFIKIIRREPISIETQEQKSL